MKHPFTWIPEPTQPPVFIGLLVVALAASVAMLILDLPLRTDAAPSGIVSFQLAGSLPAAEAILVSWDKRIRIYAGLSLGLDYLYCVVYAGSIGLGCVLVARNLSSREKRLFQLGIVLSWGLMVAALLDGVENYALIQLLLGNRLAVWPVLAICCAVPKFALILLGVIYLFAGALVVLAKKLKWNA